MTDNIITPVGRFVSGSLTEKRTTDHEGRPKREEDQRYEFGVAFRKDAIAHPPALSSNELIAHIHGVAMTKHAHLPAVQQFKLKEGYSWKIGDGDAPNSEGKVNENTVGCWVIYFSTGYPPRACDRRDPINPEIDPHEIKRGYFVDMVMNVVPNDSTSKPGVYVNPVFVGLVAFGEEIRGGVDAKTAFGGAQPAQLPPGASATPLPGSAPSGAMMAGNPAPGAAQPASNPAASPLPGPTAFPGNAQAAPAPHHGFVDNATRGPGIPS